jgi:hypothetical protein
MRRQAKPSGGATRYFRHECGASVDALGGPAAMAFQVELSGAGGLRRAGCRPDGDGLQVLSGRGGTHRSDSERTGLAPLRARLAAAPSMRGSSTLSGPALRFPCQARRARQSRCDMPVGPSRGRRATTALAAALAGTATVAVLALRRKTPRPSSAVGPPDDPELTVGPGGAAHPDEQAGTSTAAPARGWRWLRVFCSLVLPPAVVAAAIFAPVPRGGFVTRILIVAGVELVLTGLLRRTNPGRARWVTIILGVWLALFWLGSALALLGQLTEQVTFFQFQDQVDPVTILVLVLVGILVLCVPATLLVARAETRRVTEPALYAVIAIIIGSLCLPALGTLTRAAAAVTDNGSVTLYVASRSTRFTLSSELTLPGIGSAQYGGKTRGRTPGIGESGHTRHDRSSVAHESDSAACSVPS